jgi:serine/threonine-protein kinase SRPK3
MKNLSKCQLIYIQTSEVLTGLCAFHPKGGANFELEDDHLARMIGLTGEKFPPSLIAKAELGENTSTITASDYVSHLRKFSVMYVGNLLRIEQLVPVGIEATLKDVSARGDKTAFLS